MTSAHTEGSGARKEAPAPADPQRRETRRRERREPQGEHTQPRTELPRQNNKQTNKNNEKSDRQILQTNAEQTTHRQENQTSNDRKSFPIAESLDMSHSKYNPTKRQKSKVQISTAKRQRKQTPKIHPKISTRNRTMRQLKRHPKKNPKSNLRMWQKDVLSE